MDAPKMNGVSTDINVSFRQTLMNIKALNGQSDNASKEDDIVILDELSTSKPVTQAPLLPPSLCPPQITAGTCLPPIYESPQKNKFEINDRVRSNFKDIMSKIQENTPSLGSLLSKTKNLDTRESMEERERQEREKAAASAAVVNTVSTGNVGNLFENLKGLTDTDKVKTETKPVVPKSTADNVENEEKEQTKPENGKDVDIILLDDSVEEETSKDQPKADCDTDENKAISVDGKEESKDMEDELLKSDSDVDDVTEVKLETKVEENEEAMSKEEDILLASDDDMKTDDPSSPRNDQPMELKEENEESQKSTTSNSQSSQAESDSDTKSKVEDKLDSDHDENSNTSENSERKRPAETSDSAIEPKRSRLDMVIGKLGTQIGIEPESLEEELDEDMSGTEETESKSEETSATDEDEEENDTSQINVHQKKKRFRVTQKELEALVKSKVKSYIEAHRDKEMQEMHKKLEEVQSTCELWKSKYKELEMKILEVTVLQQTHEKRKAKTAALRQISTKNVGIQVDENKANAMSQLSQQQTPNKSTPKTPPKSGPILVPMPTAIKSPVSTNSIVVHNPPVKTVSAVENIPPKLIPMTSTQVSQNHIQTTVPRLVPTLTPAPVMTTVQSSVKMFPNSVTVKSLIDSTRKDNVIPSTVKSVVGNLLDPVRKDSLQGSVAGKIISQPPVQGLIPVLVSTNQTVGGLGKPVLSKLNSTAVPVQTLSSDRTEKVIDLTGEEENNAKRMPLSHIGVPIVNTGIGTVPTAGIQMMRPVLPTSQGLPQHSGILLSTPAGAQIVRNPQQQAFQLVFNSSSPAIRPGQLVTVVSGPGNNIGLRPIMGNPVSSTAPTTQSPQVRPASTIPRQPVQQIRTTIRQPPPLQAAPPVTNTQKIPNTTKDAELAHPARLPAQPKDQVKPGQKPLPPRPTLKISRVSQGIVLSWNMMLNQTPHADIASYQLFAYQEGSSPPNTNLWKKVGDVKALPLPMACTLTQFQEGNRYHFAVRAVDVHQRVGPFSEPSTIHLTKKD